MAGGGCSGFNYQLGFDREFDEQRDTKYDCHGVGVVVSEKPLYLDKHRASIPFESIERRGFTFDNPNADWQELRLRQLVPGVTGRRFVTRVCPTAFVLWLLIPGVNGQRGQQVRRVWLRRVTLVLVLAAAVFAGPGLPGPARQAGPLAVARRPSLLGQQPPPCPAACV